MAGVSPEFWGIGLPQGGWRALFTVRENSLCKGGRKGGDFFLGAPSPGVRKSGVRRVFFLFVARKWEQPRAFLFRTVLRGTGGSHGGHTAG